MAAIVHAADIQDRDGGVLLMATLFGLYPFLLTLYADGGYAGPQFQAGLARVMGRVSIEIVKRSDAAKGFAVLPKRWLVERTIAWLNRCRRLAQGLGMPEPTSARVHPSRVHPPHAPETKPDNDIIADRYLGLTWFGSVWNRSGQPPGGSGALQISHSISTTALLLLFTTCLAGIEPVAMHRAN